MESRRLFEPKGWLDRVLYALLALSGPTTAIIPFRNPELHVPAFIMGIWSLIAAFYTIEWAVLSYRAWRQRQRAKARMEPENSHPGRVIPPGMSLTRFLMDAAGDLRELQASKGSPAIIEKRHREEQRVIGSALTTKGPVYKCGPSDHVVFVDASESDVTVVLCSSGTLVKKIDYSDHIVIVEGPGDIGTSRLEAPLSVWPHEANWLRTEKQ